MFFIACLLCAADLHAQRKDSGQIKVPLDSLQQVAKPVSLSKYDSMLKKHSPKIAAVRSALVPGWGQIYNRKYWKLPIVYGALGVTGGVFVYNLTNYRDLRFAYKARIEASPSAANPHPTAADSVDYYKAKPLIRDLDINALLTYRDDFRRNIDYSVLVFILLWGLNVADAAVDAHLKAFDVSPDLSFHIKFGHSQLAGTNGVSLVLAFK